MHVELGNNTVKALNIIGNCVLAGILGYVGINLAKSRNEYLKERDAGFMETAREFAKNGGNFSVHTKD